MNAFFVFSAFLNFIVSFFLGILVFFKSPEKKKGIFFVFYFLAVAFWSYFYYLWQISNDADSALLWCRVLMIGAIFIPIFYFNFIIEFLNLFSKKKVIVYFNYFLAFLFLIVNLTPYFVESVSQKYIFSFWPNAGILYFPFLLFFFFLVCYGWYLLIVGFKKASNKTKKQQIKYFLIGTGIGFLGGFTNYPLWYDIPILPYGNILISLGVIFVAFSILKYRLFQVKVILTELLVIIMGVMLMILLFSMPTTSLKLLIGSVLFFFLIFGYYLIRAIHEEVKRKEDAENLLKIRTEFLSIASHQLRTPLTAIRGYLSMLEEGDYGSFPHESEEALVSIKKATMRMIKLSNNLLSVSRLETGRKIDLIIEEFNFNEIFEDIFTELKVLSKEKGLYLKWNNELSEETIAKGDAGKIKQIVGNIIENCIHYTSKGGITVETKKNFNKLIIKVIDTGVGMEKQDLSKLFKVFSRGRAGNQFYSQGSGLGLYIVKKFITMHRGKILVTSEGKDKGSCFYVELPIL